MALILLFLLTIAVIPWASGMPPTYLHELIEDEAHYCGVDAALVKAVIAVESRYYTNARSPKGAMGLMQLMPDTVRRFGVDDPWNPRQNIKGGVRYLRFLLDRFGGNLSLALAGYNAGENSVIRYGGIPPYPETREYISRVLEYLREPNYIYTKPVFKQDVSAWMFSSNLTGSACRRGQSCRFSESDKQKLIAQRLLWREAAQLKRAMLRNE